MKLFSIINLSVFILTSAAIGTARADIYKCTTASGKVMRSDRLIPECVNRPIIVVKNTGQIKEVIAPPLSVEERRKVELENERTRQETLLEERRQKDERYLLAHYRNEGDIERARKRSLDVVSEKKQLSQEQYNSFSELINALTLEQQKLDSTGSQYASLKRRADELSNALKNNRRLMVAYDEEIARVNAEFDDKLNRFRSIVLRGRQ